MELFKQFMAFPMFATCVWLLWVLAQQVDAGGVGLALGVVVPWASRAGRSGCRSAARIRSAGWRSPARWSLHSPSRRSSTTEPPRGRAGQ